MGFTVTKEIEEVRQGNSDLPSKNRVWGNFETPNKTRLENHRQPLKTQLGKPTYTYKIVSGRTLWPSRDPIEEYGGLNLYGFADNDSVNQWDYLGKWPAGPLGPPRPTSPPAPIPRNPSLNELGVEGSNAADEASKKDDQQPGQVEYCGMICKHRLTGKRIRTGPVRGEYVVNSHSQCKPTDAPCPFCYRAIGAYHTHTKNSKYGPPSPGDKKYAKRNRFPYYTGRGNGRVDKINPDGTIDVISH